MFIGSNRDSLCACMLISVQCMRFSQMNHLLYYVSKSIDRRHSRPEGKSTKESTLCRIRVDTTQTQWWVKNNYNYVLSIYKQSMCSTVKTKVVCADNSDIFHWDLIASRTQHTTQWLNIHSLLLDILTYIHQYPGNIQMIGKWNINIIIWTFHSMVDMCGSNTFLKVLEIWVAAHRSMYTMDETLFAYVIDPSDVFFSFTLSLSLC